MRLIIILLLLLLQTLSYGQGLDRAKQAYQTGDYPAALQAAVKIYDEAGYNGNQRQLADAGNLIGLVQLAQGHAKPALVVPALISGASAQSTGVTLPQKKSATIRL